MKGRWVIVVLALTASCAFALSVHQGHWWSIHTTEVGPFGSVRCIHGQCEAIGLGWAGDDAWTRLGKATWAAGLIAMLVLLALAAAAAANRRPLLVSKLAVVAISTATIAGAAFVALFPEFREAELGRGIVLFVAAIATGAAAAILALRGLRDRPH